VLERPFRTVHRPCDVPAAIHRPVLLNATIEIPRSIGAFRRAIKFSQTPNKIADTKSEIAMAVLSVRNLIVTYYRHQTAIIGSQSV
jgi:hypothetical protein